MISMSSNPSDANANWAGPGDRFRRGCGGAARWRPLELAAMILGFMVYWPVGLAIVGLKIWQKKSGYQGNLVNFIENRAEQARNACRSWKSEAARGYGFRGQGFGGGGWNMRSTGNAAFDDWRATELARLEEERRKLEEAERDFAQHIGELRRARDREEFERFMNARRNRPADSNDKPAA